jgi:hypothetical protein
MRAEKPIFLVKILKFFNAHPGSRIRDGKIQIRDQGFRMVKILIRDPGWKNFGSGIQDLG